MALLCSRDPRTPRLCDRDGFPLGHLVEQPGKVGLRLVGADPPFSCVSEHSPELRPPPCSGAMSATHDRRPPAHVDDTAPGGPEVGPISIEVDAPAGAVYAMMAAIGDESGADRRPVETVTADREVIREFSTPVSLPFGLRRTVQTREAIRLAPPDAIEFRHLAGPMRGLAERIVVEPLGDARCRITYRGKLPASGTLLRLGYRLIARRTIERIVRSHFADLAKRAEAVERPHPTGLPAIGEH